MKILIAEDDATTRLMLAALLRKGGYDVVETTNGAEAWDVLQKPDAPKMAVLDWMMPVMDGVDVCRRLRAMPTTDPPYLILLTSRDDENSIVEGLDAGANDYLTKPFRSEELRARLGVGGRMLQLQADLNGAKAALAHEAMHDALTGVFNRRAILEGLSREHSRAERRGSTLSIGLCDIDHFKQVNDCYGHLVGDEVLKIVAGVIRSNLRRYDLLGRYGGEEFLVVVPYSSGTADESIYERLRKAVAQTQIAVGEDGLRVAVSVGVAGGTGGTSPDQLLAEADSALYRAKNAGRNRVVYADPKNRPPNS